MILRTYNYNNCFSPYDNDDDDDDHDNDDVTSDIDGGCGVLLIMLNPSQI